MGGATDRGRGSHLVCDQVIVADGTTVVADLGWNKVVLGGSHYIVVRTDDATGSPPTGALSIAAILQHGMGNPREADIAAIGTATTTTAITATGTQFESKVVTNSSTPTYLAMFMRLLFTVSAATAWNGGTRLRVWLIGTL